MANKNKKDVNLNEKNKTESRNFEEQVFLDFVDKIEIPTNPLSFYFNLKKIEKDLSEKVRKYFYKAVEYFVTYENKDENKNENKNEDKDKEKDKGYAITKSVQKKYKYTDFLFKLYYYSGITKHIALGLDDFLNKLKFYDPELFLELGLNLDYNLRSKIECICTNIKSLNKKKNINTSKKLDKLISYLRKKNYTNLQNQSDKEESNKSNENKRQWILTFLEFLKKLDKSRYLEVMEQLSVDLSSYKLSYLETNKFFEEYLEDNRYIYTNVMICFAKVVSYYDRDHCIAKSSFERMYLKLFNREKYFKYNAIANIIEKNLKYETFRQLFVGDLNNTLTAFFENKDEIRKTLLTYLVNSSEKLRNILYWEAVTKRLSEDEWANMGSPSVFYFKKLNGDVSYFFKQFKDTLIDLKSSLFWPVIKPYFYYIVVFKSLKFPLKGWQKLFFLLMFFSAESYDEYIQLHGIYKDIERIGLWDDKSGNGLGYSILFYAKRIFTLLIPVYISSFVVIIVFMALLWALGILNIFMVIVLFLLVLINFARQIFFSIFKFEIISTFVLIVFYVLGYVWFTTVFPKISSYKYLEHLGNVLNAVANLDWEDIKKEHKSIMEYVYGTGYKKVEKKFLALAESFKKSESVVALMENSEKTASSILDEYILVKKGEYLKLIIDRQIEKLIPGINLKDKNELAKKVYQKYLSYYCSLHRDYYCKTKLETIPVGFKVNLTKINEFIKQLSGV